MHASEKATFEFSDFKVRNQFLKSTTVHYQPPLLKHQTLCSASVSCFPLPWTRCA